MPTQPPLVTVARLALFVHTPISLVPAADSCQPPEDVVNDSNTKESAIL